MGCIYTDRSLENVCRSVSETKPLSMLKNDIV